MRSHQASKVLCEAGPGVEWAGGDMVIPVDPLQGPAVVLGMAGAALVASPSQGVRRAGFGARVVGNLLWAIYATAEGNAYDDSLRVLLGHGGTGTDEHAGRGGCGQVPIAGLNDMDRCPL